MSSIDVMSIGSKIPPWYVVLIPIPSERHVDTVSLDRRRKANTEAFKTASRVESTPGRNSLYSMELQVSIDMVGGAWQRRILDNDPEPFHVKRNHLLGGWSNVCVFNLMF